MAAHLFLYIAVMPNTPLIAEVRNRYIALTKQFFNELDQGRLLEELQPLQEEIEKTLLELDDLEKQETDGTN